MFECWSRLFPVFSWKFVCYLYPVQHDSTSKQSFHSKMFFEKWNGNEKPKKISEVGVRGISGTRRRGFQILVGQVGQGEEGIQIFVGQMGQGQGVCPLEPFHLSRMGLQGREIFLVPILLGITYGSISIVSSVAAFVPKTDPKIWMQAVSILVERTI